MSMKQNIFFTYRTELVSRWYEAFPGAHVLPYPAQGKVYDFDKTSTLIWLHVQAESTGLAERIAQINAATGGCPVVVLSNMPGNDEGLVAFSAGAVGYCNALALPDVLRQVGSVVEQGGLWIGQELMRRLFGAIAARTSQTKAPGLDDLSPRERQVAVAVAHGGTNKEIARVMGITERTVKAHLSAIFEKLGVRDRLQLSLVVNGVEKSTPEPIKIPA